MIFRTSTCLTMLLAAGTGLYLYQTKHRSQLLDREIVRTIKQTEQVRERSTALQGEWAVLNEIDRLSELAKLHASALRNPAAGQFVSLADLPARLPAPLPPGSMTITPDDEMAATALSPAQLALARSGLPQPAAKAPAADAPEPAAVPASEPKPAPPPTPPKPIVTAARAVPPVPRAAHVAEATSRPAEPAPVARISAPVVAVAAASIPSGNYIGESVARVSRGLPPIQAPYAAPAYTRAAVTPVSSIPAASMLGSGTHPSLPPPTPYAGN